VDDIGLCREREEMGRRRKLGISTSVIFGQAGEIGFSIYGLLHMIKAATYNAAARSTGQNGVVFFRCLVIDPLISCNR
jgi:hypothetical protein